MKGKKSYDCKILIPFGAFLTATSILIAVDVVFLQLWISFQKPINDQRWEAVALATIFVCYFVVLSIVSMIVATLNKEKTQEDYEVQGIPVILFFFSLGFTMCFVFQSIVTLATKIISEISVNNTFYQRDYRLWFIGLFSLIVLVTIWAIVRPRFWDRLIGYFKDKPGYLMLVILGILIVITGAELLMAMSKCCLDWWDIIRRWCYFVNYYVLSFP